MPAPETRFPGMPTGARLTISPGESDMNRPQGETCTFINTPSGKNEATYLSIGGRASVKKNLPQQCRGYSADWRTGEVGSSYGHCLVVRRYQDAGKPVFAQAAEKGQMQGGAPIGWVPGEVRGILRTPGTRADY